ncbi:MAG: sugar phosphate isomerase/epimerase family protein [Anaerolineae bacterium]
MSRPISLGICIGADRVSDLAPGYDYIEPTVISTLVPLESDETFAVKLPALSKLTPPIRAFNVFLASEIKVAGDAVDWDQVEHYVATAIRRAAGVGAKLIVFGSGKARSVPEGFSRATAWGQLVRFLNICAGHVAAAGITIAIEPLNRHESNIINTYLEGVQLAKDVDRSQVRVLADLYHMMMDSEPLDDISREPDWLTHVHVADSNRRYPGSGSYPLARLVAILKDVGYEGGVSIECAWGDALSEESGHALRFLRGLAD